MGYGHHEVRFLQIESQYAVDVDIHRKDDYQCDYSDYDAFSKPGHGFA
jgi:hypothetical protein